MMTISSRLMSTMRKPSSTAKSAKSLRSVRAANAFLQTCPVFLTFFFDSVVCLSRAVKEKYGSDADTEDLSSDESDSESDESEDEDGEELTPALDAAILRTLARIKARDPGIYDASRNVFEGAPFLTGAFPLRLFLRNAVSIGQRSTASLARYRRPRTERRRPRKTSR